MVSNAPSELGDALLSGSRGALDLGREWPLSLHLCDTHTLDTERALRRDGGWILLVVTFLSHAIDFTRAGSVTFERDHGLAVQIL